MSNLYRTDAKWVLSRKIFLKFFFQSTKDYSRYKVKTTTLDSFVKKKGINLIDILKVDIDGSENQFLKGATKTIKNKVRRLSDTSLDLELLDQQARIILGMIGEEELIVF